MISTCHNSHTIEPLTMRRRNKAQCLHIALLDWFKAPLIHQVTRQADCIHVNVTDNVRVVKVRITISDEAGNTLEQETHRMWMLPSGSSEGRVTGEAVDPAGNVTCRES